MLGFEERGKPEYLGKNLSSREENQQQICIPCYANVSHCVAKRMDFILVLTSHYSLFLICFIAVFRWNLKLTPDNSSYWSPWQPWSSCSTPCVSGVKRRMRTCLTSDGSGCSGSETMTSECSNPVCFGRQLSFLFLSLMWLSVLVAGSPILYNLLSQRQGSSTPTIEKN